MWGGYTLKRLEVENGHLPTEVLDMQPNCGLQLCPTSLIWVLAWAQCDGSVTLSN